MAPSPLAWLLCLVAFCHLCTLLEGQHLGVTKCNITCHKMTSKIPVALLIRYWPNQESCGRRAIVLETRQHKNFCADPNEKWVKDAMKHLDHLTAAPAQNNGKFEKLVNVTSGITPATKGLPPSVLTEPEATEILELTTISQESQRPTGTSQEPPATVIQSSHSTSQAQDAGLATRPQTTEIFEKAAISTTIWQSSAAYQSKSRLQLEDQATGSPSTQAPTTLHSTPENAVSKGQTPSPAMSAVSKGQTPSPAMSAVSKGQTPSPASSLRSEETNQAHTDNFQDREPGNTVHPSVAPISSEGIPNPDLVASGSWSPKAEEPIHATAESQKRSVFITPVPDSQAATRRQAVGLLAFLGLLFCLGVAMFAYQSFQGCPRKMAGEMVEGLRYVPRSCGSNSYVLVPV